MARERCLKQVHLPATMRQSLIYIEFLDIAGLPLQDTEFVRFTRRAFSSGCLRPKAGAATGFISSIPKNSRGFFMAVRQGPAPRATGFAQSRPATSAGYSSPSVCGKSIKRCVAIYLPGIEPRRGKIRTVWCVGIDLRFQAECAILPVNAAILAGHGSVEEIA